MPTRRQIANHALRRISNVACENSTRYRIRQIGPYAFIRFPTMLFKQDVEAGGGGGVTVTLPFGADASGEVGYIVSLPGEVCARCTKPRAGRPVDGTFGQSRVKDWPPIKGKRFLQ